MASPSKSSLRPRKIASSVEIMSDLPNRRGREMKQNLAFTLRTSA